MSEETVIAPKTKPLLHLSGTTQTPPGGWTYKVHQLSVRFPKLAWVGPFHTYHDLLNEVKKRCKAHELPMPTEAEVQDQICQRLPPGYCRDETGAAVNGAARGDFSVTFDAVIQGSKSLWSWFKHGPVSDDEVVRRSYICNQCPENLPISGCRSCNASSLHEVVNKIVVNRPLPTDDLLHACRVCSCSLKSKTRMRLEDVVPHMSPQQIAALPNHCWLLGDKEPDKPAADILT